MSRMLKRRPALLGALLGVTGTLALVLGLGVFADAGTAAALEKPENTSPPTVRGTPREGETLRGTRGTWRNNPTDYNYSWLRCDESGGSCSAISGATSDRYVLKGVDVGNTIRFRVQAVNADGTTNASSVPTAVIRERAPAPPPPPAPPATGCPGGTGTLAIASLSPPARLLLESQQASPSVVTAGTQQLILRYRVTACGGRPVQGALVHAAVVPFNQFSTPAEATTGGDGWAEIDMRALRGFPVSPVQQLLAVFARARKPGDNLLGGISTRRLFSVPVRLR